MKCFKLCSMLKVTLTQSLAYFEHFVASFTLDIALHSLLALFFSEQKVLLPLQTKKLAE